MASLDQKVALVLGGSRGIGAAIVERLARDGARTYFTFAGSKAAAEVLAERTGATAFRVNSADRMAVAACIEGLDKLDILVISAGVAALWDARDIDPAEVDHMIDINVRGPYHAAVAGARQYSVSIGAPITRQ